MAALKTDRDADKAKRKPVKEPPQNYENLLLRVAQGKDRQAFIELFEYFAPRVKAYLMKAGLEPGIADEIAQDVMLTVWRRAPAYNPALANASTWIFTIARNKRIDFLRKRKLSGTEANTSFLFENANSSPLQELERKREADIVSEAIRELPDEQASVLFKAYFEGKTHQTIAEEENLPTGTVKSRIRLALERLKKQEKIKELWK